MPFAVRSAVAGSMLAVLAATAAPQALAQSEGSGFAAVVASPVSGQSAATADAPAAAVAPARETTVAPVESKPGEAAATPAAVASPTEASKPANVQPKAETASPAVTATPVQPAAAAATEAPSAPPPAFVLDVAAALERLGPKAQIDKRDRAGLLAAYTARRGEPIWVGPKGPTADAPKLAAEIRNADAWGLKASAFDVPKLDKAGAGALDVAADALADTEVRLSLAALKYARHARGGRVEPTALTPFLDRKSQAYDPASVLGQIATAADPGEYLRSLHPKHPQFASLRQKLLSLRKGDVADTAAPVVVPAPEAAEGKGGRRTAKAPVPDAPLSAQRLLANMEQWRWMSDDLGSFHVWVNVPEYLIRVVSNGKVIHTERVVVGKLDTQTPIFSDEMEQVIFHPFWGVPESIKTNEILPSLKGNGAVLGKYNLRIQSGGKDIDPKSVDWTKTDIRKFHVYQPPGGDNVLGVVKFRFPNKHDVYMHDTPSKSLFKTAVRTFSHGCMRVQDPVKLAELLLAEDKKMAPEKVRGFTQKEAPENNQLNLSRRIPVHVTYFTASVDPAGKVTTFKDVYGHEERVSLGLDGKMHLIQPVPEVKGPAAAEPVGQLAEIKANEKDWARAVFSGGN